MPMAAPCPCSTCGRLHCTAHVRTAWRTTHQPARIRGRKLQALRASLFRRQPLCVVCLSEGQQTLATIRDHIIPLAEGGRDDATNEQALCQHHSDVKTQEEAKRGVRRWR